MLTVVFRPLARRQRDQLTARARRRLEAALCVLAHVPRSGRPYPGLRDTYSKTVMIRRRWSLRIVYQLTGSKLEVTSRRAGSRVICSD